MDIGGGHVSGWGGQGRTRLKSGQCAVTMEMAI